MLRIATKTAWYATYAKYSHEDLPGYNLLGTFLAAQQELAAGAGAASEVVQASAYAEDVSLLMAVGGTQRAGFLTKKLEARSMTLTGSAGMTGKSSVRGKWVRPNWM